MKTALFISPHLDDVIFSCGGTLARLSAEGWRTVLATVFTRSVSNPTGFALECQLDKGLPADVDYMALRREEDRRAADSVGVDDLLWLDYPEAPHRGYESAPDLFDEVCPGDEVWTEISGNLRDLFYRHEPEVVFAPQAPGGHVDHLQTIRAVLETIPTEKVCWYRDTPYAIRSPEARPSSLLPHGMTETGLDISSSLKTKLDACSSYASQLGFQFGGDKKMREALSKFAEEEARRTGRRVATEVLLAFPEAILYLA